MKPQETITRPPRGAIFAACLLFFGSGALALVYELAWVRLISLNLGSESLALTLVLSVFMGGLAIGAWAGGRWADRGRKPLTRYGIIELLIALYGAISPFLFPAVMTTVVDQTMAWGWTDRFAALTLIRFVVAALLLLPPTILMGATLPLLTHYYAMIRSDASRGAGLLYGLNTLGAFIGTLLAGFILMPTLGMNGTLIFGSASNVLLAVAAVLLGRQIERPTTISPPSTQNPPSLSPTNPPTLWRVHLTVFLTGMAFMICEIAWFRVLSLTLGASIFAVTIVLATVLAGLGLGAAVVASFKVRAEHASRLFYRLALASAMAVALSTAILPSMPKFFLWLFWTFDLSTGLIPIVLTESFISAIIMLPAAILMGGLFPAAARICVTQSQNSATNTGRLYAWNTIGDILGAAAAGIVLIPLLGIRATLLVAATAQSVAAACILLRWPVQNSPAWPVVAAVALPGILILFTPGWDELLMTCGMYQYAPTRQVVLGNDLTIMLHQNKRLLFYRDGWTATVTVMENRADGRLALTVNGKVDGSTGEDISTQKLIAHVPLAIHPDPRNVCVIGMGTGCTAGSASLYPVDTIDVVELEDAVVEAARLFRGVNRDLHENPRVNIHVTDGRFFLRVHPAAYDVVLSEPSNPWQVGNSDLFTVEYFRLGAAALREGGLFCQWLPIYELSPQNIQIIIRTFSNVFPHVYLAQLDTGNLLLIGSMAPHPLDLALAARRVTQDRGISADLADPIVNIHNLADFLALIRLGPTSVVELAETGTLHTDNLPVIAYRAPADLFRTTASDNQALLARFADGAAPHIGTWPYTAEPENQRFLDELAAKYRELYGESSKEALTSDPPSP